MKSVISNTLLFIFYSFLFYYAFAENASIIIPERFDSQKFYIKRNRVKNNIPLTTEMRNCKIKAARSIYYASSISKIS